jgi:mRNA interferase HigB
MRAASPWSSPGCATSGIRRALGIAERALWTGHAQIKSQFRNASFVGDDRVIFNIAGNKYRPIVHMNYRTQAAYICFIGTHEDYDAIDPEEV